MTRLALIALLLMALPVMAMAQEPPATERFDRVDCVIESLETSLPKDLIRAIAWRETEWQQFFLDGSVYKCDSDYGIMQINENTAIGYKGWSLAKAKQSEIYNIRFGVMILEDKFRWAAVIKKQRPRWLRRLCKQTETEIAIRAYNGISNSRQYYLDVMRIAEDKPWLKYMSEK